MRRPWVEGSGSTYLPTTFLVASFKKNGYLCTDHHLWKCELYQKGSKGRESRGKPISQPSKEAFLEEIEDQQLPRDADQACLAKRGRLISLLKGPL